MMSLDLTLLKPQRYFLAGKEQTTSVSSQLTTLPQSGLFTSSSSQVTVPYYQHNKNGYLGLWNSICCIKQESPIPSKTHLKLLKLYYNYILTYTRIVWTIFINCTNWKKQSPPKYQESSLHHICLFMGGTMSTRVF